MNIKEKNYKISICIPYYNASKFFTEALNSISKQSYTNWEVIICNDASTHEETNKMTSILKHFANEGFKYRLITNQDNLGIYSTRWKLFKEAQGDIIMSLDADDYFLDQDVLKTINNKFNEDDYDMVIFNSTRDGSGKLYNNYDNLFNNASMLDIYTIKKEFLINNKLNYIHVKAFKTGLIKHISYENYRIDCAEDRLHTAHLLNYSDKVALINEALYFYRWNEDSVIGSVENTINHLKDGFFVEEKVNEICKKWKINYNFSQQMYYVFYTYIFWYWKNKRSAKELANIHKKIKENNYLYSILYNHSWNLRFYQKLFLWLFKHELYFFFILYLKVSDSIYHKQKE